MKVSLQKKDLVGVVTINNPPVNALSREVMNGIISCLNEAEKDQTVRVVIFKGAGEEAFVAGADIKEFPDLLGGNTSALDFVRHGHTMFNAVNSFFKPTIATINGLALGGGCELALACDLRVASEKALFGLPEIKLGIFPGGGGTQRLPRLIGEAKAKEIMYLGNHFSAQEALQMGLVNRVVPHKDLLQHSLHLAEEISSRPGVAINLIKQCVDQGMQTTLEQGLELEIRLFDQVFKTHDCQEGIEAFIQKRKPEYQHK